MKIHKCCNEFRKRKKKGFVITFEVLATTVVMCLLLMGNVYVLQGMDRQKFMYNCAISATSQAARWGGTNNTLYQTYSKTGMSIQDNMVKEIERATGQTVNLTITPDVVTSSSEIIVCDLQWKDVGLWFWNGSMHSVHLESESIVNSGKLIMQ